MNYAKRLPWSDCQPVAVETDEGTIDAVTMLEALMRLPSEHGSGRPEMAEEKPRPKVKLAFTTCGAIIEVPDEDHVPDFQMQVEPEGKCLHAEQTAL